MRYSQLLLKTRPQVEVGEATNAKLLTRGGFIEQVMAGVHAYLPLGWRVLNKIENIVRGEMNTLGTELLLPALSPRKLWQQTERDNIDVLLEARGANPTSLARNKMGAILNPTHEDVLTPIVQKIKPSYKDLPLAVYQIQTKFRNEERPKSGLMRGREFRMKDLYSFHASQENLQEFYEEAKQVYQRLFERLGLGEETIITKASGGDFTNDYSHEFQTVCPTGEDVIYIHRETGEAYNQEVLPADTPLDLYEKKAASEVGNIFPLGTKFSQAFNYTYTDKDGKPQLVHMASYGIGTSRVMGVLVEKFYDERGIIWPISVAPFQVYLVALEPAEEIYRGLQEAGVEVLYDDRKSASAGDKLAYSDLLGIPWRFVVSKKTAGKMELKRRTESVTKLVSFEEFLKEL
jgi:prolyl-tRNA synthetase